MRIHVSVIMLFIFAHTCYTQPDSGRVFTGLDNLHEHAALFANKRVGIITNHTARDFEGKHIVDKFFEMEQVQVTALFGPEHGIRGDADAGGKIDDAVDPVKQIPIYSLYGKNVKPTPEMLENVDVLVFDIQDVGARFYTYIWTMALAMEAAAENAKTFVVLDRPNPINGVAVEGNLLDAGFASFVGLYPIPIRHGMTVGELAKMFNNEGWLENGLRADLEVIPMRNWKRDYWYDDTELKFIKPSPNMPDLETATVYPGLCLLEGVNVSEGRGTHKPFLQFGAPWIDSDLLAKTLNALKLPGISFKPKSFTPVAIEGMSMHPKYKDAACGGVIIKITDRDQFSPYRSGIAIIATIRDLFPDHFKWRDRIFDRLTGTSTIREALKNEVIINDIVNNWQAELRQFMAIREKYLLYE